MADVADHESWSLKIAHGAVESYFAIDDNPGDNKEVDYKRTKKTTPKHIRCSLVFVACTVIWFALVAGIKIHSGLQGGSTNANVIEAIYGEPTAFANKKKKDKKKKQKTTTTGGGGSSFNCGTAAFACTRSPCDINAEYLGDTTCAADLGGGSYAVGTLDFSSCSGAITVPDVTTVCGNVTAQFTTNLNSIDIPALASVEGDFLIGFTANLNSIDIPALASVGGDFAIGNNGHLNPIDAPVLASVGGGFALFINANLNSIDIPALASVGRDFLITLNADFVTIENCIIGDGSPFVPIAVCTVQANCVEAEICIQSL